MDRVGTGPENPEKSSNFILEFSRIGKSCKINAGPRKSWKPINSWKKVFFENNIVCSIILDFHFIRSYCFSYWKSPGKLFLKKGMNPEFSTQWPLCHARQLVNGHFAAISCLL